MKLRKGDQIKVIRGKDKGKTGKVDKVFIKEEKVLIAGVNEYKRHMKARSQSQPSEIVTIAKPLSLANVQFVCPKCKLVSRVGFLINGKKKTRICRKCQQEV